MRRNDDDIDASIEAPAIFCGVVSDRVIFSVTGGREALGANAFAGKQEPDDLGSTGGGKLPIRLKLSRVDGYVVCMTLNAEIACDCGEDRADTVEGVHGVGAQSRRAAIEESDLAKAEDESLGSLAERDSVAFKVCSKAALKFVADAFGALREAGRRSEGSRRSAGDDNAGPTRTCTDAELLEAGGDGAGQACHSGLIHLGRRVEDDEEGEEQGHEIGIGDHPSFLVAMLLHPLLHYAPRALLFGSSSDGVPDLCFSVTC